MVKRLVLLGLLSLTCGSVHAAHPVSPAPIPAHPAKSPPADPALLEFLGTWEQGPQGQWMDPMSFAALDPAKIAAADARLRDHTAVGLPAKPSATYKGGASGGRAG